MCSEVKKGFQCVCTSFSRLSLLLFYFHFGRIFHLLHPRLPRYTERPVGTPMPSSGLSRRRFRVSRLLSFLEGFCPSVDYKNHSVDLSRALLSRLRFVKCFMTLGASKEAKLSNTLSDRKTFLKLHPGKDMVLTSQAEAEESDVIRSNEPLSIFSFPLRLEV